MQQHQLAAAPHFFAPSSSPSSPHPASHLLPAPAMLPTPRFRKRSAQGLDPIDEAAPPDPALEWGPSHARQTSAGGVGLGLGLDDGRAAKRVRADVDVEPAFASLSLTSASVPTLPALFTSSPPTQAANPTALYAPPLQPLPAPGLVPPLFPPAPCNNLPVTPPLQQGEASTTAPPLIRTHRPTPTPSPPSAYAEDSRMSSSYDLNRHVVYVASLDDSDDDEEPVPVLAGEARLELHPALLAATSKPPSPLPPELVMPRPEEMGLVLYRPLKFGLEDERTHQDEYSEFQRRAAEEEHKYDSGEAELGSVGAGMVEDEDVEMDAMDVDG